MGTVNEGIRSLAETWIQSVVAVMVIVSLIIYQKTPLFHPSSAQVALVWPFEQGKVTAGSGACHRARRQAPGTFYLNGALNCIRRLTPR